MSSQFTSTVGGSGSSSLGGNERLRGLSAPAGVAGKTTVTSSGSGGQQYTSSESIGGGSIFGSAVKDSLRKFLERRDQRIIDLALAPGDENIAQLCWGGLNKNNPRVGLKTSFNTSDRKSQDPSPSPIEKIYQWREQERFVVKTKITNPEDEEQYIWVDVCKAMTITSPSQDPFNGKLHLFEFTGKRTQIGIDEGGAGGGGGSANDEDETEASGGSSTPGPSGRTTGTGTVGSAGANTGGGGAAP